MTRSEIFLLLFVLTSSGTLANECERDGYSVFEVSTCLSCGGCYDLVESYYNTSLEAHVNFTTFYEHFLNLSQLNISQLVDRYQAMLRIAHNLAMETTKNERNFTFQLSVVANLTTEANKVLDMLKRNLSSAVNGSRTAKLTHNNSTTTLRELDMLVKAIDNIVSNNITVISNRTASIYGQILTKLELVDSIADNASSTSRWQEILVMAAKLGADEAHNISTAALETLCRAIELHNVTSDLVRQLNSQDAVNITTLQQQISAVVMIVQQTLSEHDVFNTSQQLINQAANISIPSYDVEVVEFMVYNVIQNVSELFIAATKTLDQLEALKEQAGDLNNTAEELLQRGRELKEEANTLFMTLNESFFRTEQNITEVEAHFNDITELHYNLTTISQLFNDSITDVVTRLEEEDAENVSRVAHDLSIGSEDDLERIQKLLSATNESLDNPANQLADDNVVLNAENERITNDIREIQGGDGIGLARRVIGLTEVEWNNALEVNDTTTDQLSQITHLNSTALTIQDTLNSLTQELGMVRDQLENLTKMLESLEFTDVDIKTAEMKVNTTDVLVKKNSDLLDQVTKKVDELKRLSDELEEKYKQLKQHRDLLQQILNNIGNNTCV